MYIHVHIAQATQRCCHLKLKIDESKGEKQLLTRKTVGELEEELEKRNQRNGKNVGERQQ